MKLGVDIDNVLCELNPPVIARVNEKYGTKLTKNDIKEWFWHFDLNGHHIEGAEEIREALDDYDFVVGLPPVKGSVNAIKVLSNWDNHITFITSRPPTRRKSTTDWIEKHFGNKIKIRFAEADKNGYEMDVLIDDAAHHIESFAKHEKLAVLFDQPWNQELDCVGNMVRMFSWKDILQNWWLIERWAKE